VNNETGGPTPSPWLNLIAFIAVLAFGALVLTSHEGNQIAQVADGVTTLYVLWRFGRGDD
jgi:hypothetical protein